MRRYNWRNSWIGRFLGIHSITAHTTGTCWCRGTKRELPNPDSFMTVSRARADLEAYYRYVSAISLGEDYERRLRHPGIDSGHQGTDKGDDESRSNAD